MKRVTVFLGSARKKNTYQAVLQFLHDLEALGEIDYEIVHLHHFDLKPCQGCETCIWKGESYCPLKDDRDLLLEKVQASDGILFATPTFNGHVSGIMKTFLDRFVYLCHRPRYFGKVSTSLVTYSFARNAQINKYLDLLAATLGFNVIPGTSVHSMPAKTAREQRKRDQARARQVRQFHVKLVKPAFPVPSMLMLIVFRMWRSLLLRSSDTSTPDYQYYAERGWLESDYYYPTRLGLLKKAAGKLIELRVA